MRRYKIVIADDHKVVASAMERLVDSFPNCEVLYTVAHGRELLDRFKKARNIPDLVILDISMPILNGFKTTEILSRDHPKVKILGLSMAENETSFIKLIELGAHGFVSKMSSDDELKQAIELVMTKGKYYSEEVTDALFNFMRNQNKKKQLSINVKEKELLSFIGSDLTYPEIAEKMKVSKKSIDNYRASLFRKIGVKSRTTLAIYAYANGYFTP